MPRTHVTEMTIRWGDMDAYGHVNNTLFFRYLESARFAFFDEVCAHVLAYPPVIILADIRCRFTAELRYPATIQIRSRVSRFGNSSFDVEAEIYQGQQLCATSLATMVWVDEQSHRPIPIPTAARQAIEVYQAEKGSG